MLKKILPLGIVFALIGCNSGENVSGEPGGESSSKPPHQFDESSILVPPDLASIRAKFRSRVEEDRKDQQAPAPLRKSAATYYTFGIGSGLSSSDYQFVYPRHANSGCGNSYWPSMTCSGNSFVEATYSSRFTSYPESLWTPNGVWMQSGDLNDNEQTEMHFTWNMSASNWDYGVRVDYEVSSEANYDWLWINSTASDASCNSPGVIRRKVSGVQTNQSVSFVIPRQCGTGWLGIYFIKDYSLSHNGDYARIKNVVIQQQIPVGTR